MTPVDQLGQVNDLGDEDQLGQVEDVGYDDAVDEAVGRPGAAYLEDWTEDECLLPSDLDPNGERAVFDRYYFATDEGEKILADTLAGGSAVEVAQEEAVKNVPAKRAWCEEHGVRYVVFVDPLTAEFS